MSFQILKGWPEGALELSIAPNATTPAAVGEIAIVGADWTPASYATDGSDASEQAAFIYDQDAVTGKLVGLLGQAILEVDSDHYAADTYAIHDKLTAASGVFAKPTTSEAVIGKVLAVDATTGKIKILWFGPNHA